MFVISAAFTKGLPGVVFVAFLESLVSESVIVLPEGLALVVFVIEIATVHLDITARESTR